MKRLFLTSVTILLIAGCSFVKDVQSHCQPSLVSGNIQTGSFNVCLKCDSLAKVVYTNVKKQIEKK